MQYIINLAIFSAIYAILGISLNLVVGYSGLFSITHAAFYGLGAYITGILLTELGMGFFTSMALGMIIVGIISLLIGLILSKFKDDYYALASLGFNVIIFSIFLNWQRLTGGPMGMPNISRPVLFNIDFSSNLIFLILSIIILVVIYLLSRFIVNSSFGRVLKALREDETTTQVFGYRTHQYKLFIFIISSVFAAIAGSLFASYITFISPSTFNVNESIFILAIVILGGLASIRGSVLGAIFLILIPEALRFVGLPDAIAAEMRQVIYGLILILLMLYRPQGFMGKYRL